MTMLIGFLLVQGKLPNFGVKLPPEILIDIIIILAKRFKRVKYF